MWYDETMAFLNETAPGYENGTTSMITSTTSTASSTRMAVKTSTTVSTVLTMVVVTTTTTTTAALLTLPISTIIEELDVPYGDTLDNRIVDVCWPSDPSLMPERGWGHDAHEKVFE